jgi:DNA anti-recombination protein RmuC
MALLSFRGNFMTSQWVILFAGATALSAVGFVFVAVLWLRKLRETLSNALAEAAGQQIRTTQRLNESIAEVQKQQDSYNRQINVLAQAGMRLQQELSNVSNRLDTSHAETTRGGQTLH